MWHSTPSVQPKIVVRIQRKGIPGKLYVQSSSPGADFEIGCALWKSSQNKTAKEMRKVGQGRGRNYFKVSWKMTPTRFCMRRLNVRTLQKESRAPMLQLPPTGPGPLKDRIAPSMPTFRAPWTCRQRGCSSLREVLETQKLSVVQRKSTLKPKRGHRNIEVTWGQLP